MSQALEHARFRSHQLRAQGVMELGTCFGNQAPQAFEACGIVIEPLDAPLGFDGQSRHDFINRCDQEGPRC